jgi:hypothetical protein
VTEDLRRRLRDADPATTGDRVSPSIRELMEAAMTTPTETSTSMKGSGGRARRRTWWTAAAAAAVAAVAVGTAVLTGDGAPSTGGNEVVRLTLPAGDQMSSCIAYSREVLAGMPVAFSGTAEEVDDGAVLLAVDEWYRGGTADVVRLANPTGATASIDGATFEAGQRYLVTADGEGNVNGCGFTGPWTPRMAEDFERAFR